MNTIQNPAALPLRDIHLPGTVSWWPLAPGWWVIIALIILILVTGIIWFKRRKQYLSSSAYQARLELERLKQLYANSSDDQQLIRSLSSLIRRVAISVYPRVDVASLSGEKWLTFLDRLMPDNPFSHGPGKVLAYGPYQADITIDAKTLFELTETWVDKATRQNRNKNHDSF